jgi:hypothetical protein
MSFWHLEVYFWIGVGVLVFLFVCVLFVAGMCERLYLIGDVGPASEPFPYPASPYWICTRHDIVQLGWQHAGDFATRKDTTVVKGLQSLFVSPDAKVIASVICGGKAVAKINKTSLRTRLADGRILESADCSAWKDPGGVFDRKVLVNADFAELVAFHKQRVLASGSTALSVNPRAACEEFEKMDWERGARWVQLGLARWVDIQQHSIRLTIRGAFTQSRNVTKATQELGDQHERVRIVRAGSRPHDRERRNQIAIGKAASADY